MTGTASHIAAISRYRPARRPGRPSRRRRDVGRRRLVGRRGAAGARRVRCRRHHIAALRPRRRDRPQGRLLRRAGCARRGARRRASRHPALRARLRGPVPRRGDRGFRRELPPRRDAGPVHPLQRAHQVPRPVGNGARSRRRRAGDRALRPPRRRAGRAGTAPRPRSRRATRAIFSIARRAPNSTSCAFRSAASRRTRRGRWRAIRPAGRRQARQPGHLLCAAGLLCRSSSTRLRPEAGEPGDIVDEQRPGARPPSTASRISRSASARASGIAAAEPLYVLRLDPETRRVVVGPRAALARDPHPSGRDELARRRRRPRAPRSVSARSCARRSRRCRRRCWPATPSGDAELVLDAPAGAVAPGQAAVLYDGDRVLGGGWIRRAAPTREAAARRPERVLDRAAISYMRSLAAPTRRSGCEASAAG